MVPPPVLGPAALVQAAMHGAQSADLVRMIATQGAAPEAFLFDTAIARQIALHRAEGLHLLRAALNTTQVFRVRNAARAGALRVLGICLAGDMMANTPLDFITNNLAVQLDLLILGPDGTLPGEIPDHDVAFFAAAEADPAQAARIGAMYAHWPRPALNDPRNLPRLRRDALHEALAPLAGIRSPRLARVPREALARFAHGALGLAEIVPNADFPLLIRPDGAHAGHGFEKLDTIAKVDGYLLAQQADDYFVSEFIDYRSTDGLFRKYRIAMIGGTPHLAHLAVSAHWMVHYLNAGMTQFPARREEEAAAFAQFDAGFATRHRHALQALQQALGFDYFLIDCAEAPDGRLLVFEADTAAIVHAMDPLADFAYKQEPMRRLFAAFEAMLRRAARIGDGHPTG